MCSRKALCWGPLGHNRVKIGSSTLPSVAPERGTQGGAFLGNKLALILGQITAAAWDERRASLAPLIRCGLVTRALQHPKGPGGLWTCDRKCEQLEGTLPARQVVEEKETALKKGSQEIAYHAERRMKAVRSTKTGDGV
ncbi:hypothetical protein NDU88_005224 [Pleurodeles waltl]|uniref:Uncharacterized protein n=1 Tax=Pleurodeles waltl TaxID=8319 RepID=A0AAV7MVM8_PLEWA|nr:hypothetical protein NDU88_005224 [Pleurodeles waltl]